VRGIAARHEGPARGRTQRLHVVTLLVERERIKGNARKGVDGMQSQEGDQLRAAGCKLVEERGQQQVFPVGGMLSRRVGGSNVVLMIPNIVVPARGQENEAY